MIPSQLQLEHYEFSTISLVAEPDYVASDDGANYPEFDESMVLFQSSINHKPLDLDDGQARFTLTLALRGKPIEGKFPYQFEVIAHGVVNGSRLPMERREALTVVNGASLLYGACRDLLLSLSYRLGNGALLLPSVQFTELIKQFTKSEASASPVPALTNEATLKVATKKAKASKRSKE